MEKIIAFLKLMRPANIVTSIADVLAGVAISGYFLNREFITGQTWPVVLLCISTFGLYGGGVVFNDVFDAELDKIERPERPIPMGTIRVKEAAFLGICLLLVGIIAAFLVNPICGALSIVIAVAAVVYDKWGKHHSFLGPLNMGLCRGLNLLLGVSILVSQLNVYWYLAIVPVIYIASITMVSRGEVHGGKSQPLFFAGFLYMIVAMSILYLAFMHNRVILTLVFLLPFAGMIFIPLLKAIQLPAGKNIGKAVKAGVMALIFLDASWSAAFGSPGFAVLITLLMPVSLYLAKKFSVT
ncbi:UbiA-like protein EboC [Flavihumibacter profundi]|uniref:UbiA-like protein EboC n=1 Tax=Flavihumibacter profundi TaxID=2716883 RepID=UPI001CC6ED66|nr:UbiA-like protein EboC [Flavihumibacter profundi]MBZ5856393.1 UbiA-like protein EboC [Flavihumibacter profundi]